MNSPDVIVVGAGLAGLVTGAILAKEEGLKVLVLEKNPIIGGRIMSFGGQHGEFTADEYRRLLWESGANTRIVASSHPVEELVEKKGLFKNYITDIGWHSASAGTRSRYATIARNLGNGFKVGFASGFSYFIDGKWTEIQDLFKGWPKESQQEKNRVARVRMNMTTQETSLYDEIDFQTWIESVTPDERTRYYYLPMALFQWGTNDPKDVSAGEWIRCQNAVSSVGGNVSQGTGIGSPIGGFKVIADSYAQIIKENGGEIITNAEVKEVIIENYKVKGVVVEQDGKTSKIMTSKVVSNLPMDTILSIVDEKYFSDAQKEKMKKIHPLAGIMLTLFTKELLETEMPKASYVLQELDALVDGRGNHPPVMFEQTSAIDPTRVLTKGANQIICCWLGGLTSYKPDQRKNDKFVLNTLDETFRWFRKVYPKFDEILDFWTCEVVERLYSIEYSPDQAGSFHFDVMSSTVKGLFYTGDGVKQNDIGCNGTALGGLYTACAVSGKNYMNLLPPTMYI